MDADKEREMTTIWMGGHLKFHTETKPSEAMGRIRHAKQFGQHAEFKEIDSNTGIETVLLINPEKVQAVTG
jgi:hypothetical protein